MMKLYSLGLWSVFVSIGVTPFLLFLTAGELGIPQNSPVTPIQMGEIRFQEATHAARVLNAQLLMLSFPDLHLPYIPIQTLVESVLPVVREHKFDAIFSFHPHEITPFFDHPDHNQVGLLAQAVGAASDVAHFMPEHPPLVQRPGLYLWTTQKVLANRELKLRKNCRKNRDFYLQTSYPSQFSREKYAEWRGIFEVITRKKAKKKRKNKDAQHAEYYLQVR